MEYIYLQISSYSMRRKYHTTFRNIDNMMIYLNNPENRLELVKEIVDSCGNLTGFLVRRKDNG